MLQYRTNSFTVRVYPFLLLLLVTSNNLFGQIQGDQPILPSKEIDNLESVYGVDPSLYNGFLYNSFFPGKVKGDQYFATSNYIKGEATIRGVKYKDIDLNYDIYKQELLLKYVNSSKVFNIISISKAWLEDFTIGETRFVIFSTPETPNKIYQVIGNDSIQVLVHWQKVIAYDNDFQGYTSLYFNINKELNVLVNKSLMKFNSNKSFVQLFAKDKQAYIKKYLRQNKIKVNSAPDQKMGELIIYCNKISIK